MQFDATTINMLKEGTMQTVYMVFMSSLISYLIGIPLGIALMVTDKDGIRPVPLFNKVLGLAINLLRSVPFLILMIMVIPFTRLVVGKIIGPNAAVVPLIIAAAPYIGRMVESSLKEVDAGVVEAAQSMGASTWQIIWKVLLPEAKPSLLVGGGHLHHHDPGLLGHGGRCGRGRAGRHRHPLRLSPLPDRHDAGDRGAAGDHRAADPGGIYENIQKERQENPLRRQKPRMIIKAHPMREI